MAKINRPPIVTVLGHVDHGKTTLLDTIRKTSVQSQETGGITQHITAYQVEIDDQLVTFIDTPGHQAFTNLRARGGSLADIVLLVVAADDGVQPQTKESIAHIKQADIPYMVVINKVDLPDVDIQKIKTQLAEEEVLVEGFGGDVPVVEVSAIKNKNLDELLETLLVLSELQELKADPQAILEATVVESQLDKRSGPLATLIIKNGSIEKNQEVSAIVGIDSEQIDGKVKSLVDWKGDQASSLGPSSPAQILGFQKVPPAGSLVTQKESVDEFKDLLEAKKSDIDVGSPQEDKINIILKTDFLGSLEAISSSLPKETQLISASTGSITESDIMQAQTGNAKILGFRVEPNQSAKQLADIEKIQIYTFESIYDLLKKIDQIIESESSPQKEEVVNGKAKVIKTFDYDDYVVIGGKVSSGAIRHQDKIKVEGTDKGAVITSLKQGDQDVKMVKKGDEFGLICKPELDIKSGDVIISYKIKSE